MGCDARLLNWDLCASRSRQLPRCCLLRLFLLLLLLFRRAKMASKKCCLRRCQVGSPFALAMYRAAGANYPLRISDTHRQMQGLIGSSLNAIVERSALFD